MRADGFTELKSSQYTSDGYIHVRNATQRWGGYATMSASATQAGLSLPLISIV